MVKHDKILGKKGYCFQDFDTNFSQMHQLKDMDVLSTYMRVSALDAFQEIVSGK